MKKYSLILEDSDTFCGTKFLSVPKLVICPESLRLNWYREIHNVTPDADIQVQLSKEEPHFGKDWTIIGYQTVAKYKDECLNYFKCVFVDECHYCKAVDNYGRPASKRSAAVIEIAEKAEYCYLLSGTPMPSHNKDLYNIMRMLKCEEFDFNTKSAFFKYANKFCAPKRTNFGMDYSGNSNSDDLHTCLSNIMIRRTKKEVLPNLKKQRQFIPIDPTFKRDYKDIENRLYSPKKDDTYMGLAMTGRQLLSQYKIDSAIDLAESILSSDESVVLVTNFIETAEILTDHFKGNCCKITGGMTDSAKQQAIDDFQSKKVKVCILNMQAGGVGITLTAAHTMIMIDYTWLPADMVQVEDRICRTGQDQCCIIYYVYCINSILDKLFIDMISDKSSNIDKVVDNTANTFDLNAEKENSFINLLKERTKNNNTEKKPKRTYKSKKAEEKELDIAV